MTDDLQQRIAYRIRAELVCCEIYGRVNDTHELTFDDFQEHHSGHDLCYWGEAAARIAEDPDGNDYGEAVNAPLHPETIAALRERLQSGNFPVRKVPVSPSKRIPCSAATLRLVGGAPAHLHLGHAWKPQSDTEPVWCPGTEQPCADGTPCAGSGCSHDRAFHQLVQLEEEIRAEHPECPAKEQQ